jgi:cell division initiation protein
MFTAIKRTANDALERADRARNQAREFDVDQHLNMAKREAKRIAFPNMDFDRIVAKVEAQHDEPLTIPFRTEPVVIKPEPAVVIREKEIVIEQHVHVAEVLAPVAAAAAPPKIMKSFFDEIG